MTPLTCFYCDSFVLPLPPNHRFPMQKYAKLRERLIHDPRFALHEAPAATDADLLRVHTPDYVQRATTGAFTERELRVLGFPWSPQLIERSRRSSGATLAAARMALKTGVAANLAGGTHHAYADQAQGFCVFNDAAVTARALQAAGLAQHVAVIDCDVHQGNGTAVIFADDPTVFTFSIHGGANFPFRKEQSDLDVALPDGTGDDEYLAALETALPIALDGADFAIYLAGADPFVGDRLGRLHLTKDGLKARDAMVFSACHQRGLPVAMAMAGGYAEQLDDIVDIHLGSLEAAAHFCRPVHGLA